MKPVMIMTILLAGLACGENKNSKASSADNARVAAAPQAPAANEAGVDDAAIPSAPPAPPKSRVVPHTIRLVLASETKVRDKVRNKLVEDLRLGGELNDSPPTDEEAAYLTKLRADTDAPGPLPEAWQTYEKVVLVSYSELSTGRKHPPRSVSVAQFAALLMPPASEALFVERAHNGLDIEESASVGVYGLGSLVQLMNAATTKASN